MSKESSIYQTETKRVKGGKKDLLEALKEALRQGDLKEVKRGIESLQKACKELDFNWWKRYPLADLIFLPKSLVQQATLFP